jgi:hypothetical protein
LTIDDGQLTIDNCKDKKITRKNQEKAESRESRIKGKQNQEKADARESRCKRKQMQEKAESRESRKLTTAR